MTASQERKIKNDPASALAVIEKLNAENKRLKQLNKVMDGQLRIADEVTIELGIIGMVGSIAWKAQILRLKI